MANLEYCTIVLTPELELFKSTDDSPPVHDGKRFHHISVTGASVLFDWILHTTEEQVVGAVVNLDDVLEIYDLSEFISSLKYTRVRGNQVEIWMTELHEGRRGNLEAFEALFYISDDNALMIELPLSWLNEEQRSTFQQLFDRL